MDEAFRRAEGERFAGEKRSTSSENTTGARLPVVDSNEVLVGIVTIDDMLDVAEEEATEDIQKFGGMEALDEPYMRDPASADGAETRGLADHSVSRRNADRDRDGELLQDEIAKAARAGAVSAVDHFERRQFRIASVNADHSRDGSGRSDPARLVARHATGTASRPRIGSDPGSDRRHPRRIWAMVAERYFHRQPTANTGLSSP